MSLLRDVPLALYIHLPWCVRKCPYCDFNSHASSTEPPFDRYLQALRCDLEAALPFIWGRRLYSIFIGGGTPSLFTPDAIDRLLADVRSLLPVEPGCEGGVVRHKLPPPGAVALLQPHRIHGVEAEAA